MKTLSIKGAHVRESEAVGTCSFTCNGSRILWVQNKRDGALEEGWYIDGIPFIPKEETVIIDSHNGIEILLNPAKELVGASVDDIAVTGWGYADADHLYNMIYDVINSGIVNQIRE